jgi:hypothetical protein
MKIASEKFELQIYTPKISITRKLHNAMRKSFLISNVISIIFYFIAPSYSFAADATSDYIKSFLGDNVSIGEIYEIRNGSPLKKRDNIRISIVNPPDKKTEMFATGKILDFANALNLNVDFQNDAVANETVIFDDFVDSNDSFKQDVFGKYGIKIKDASVFDPSLRRCFVIRGIVDGKIDEAIYIIDNKVEKYKINDCILRSIIFSFGITLHVLKSKSSDNMQSVDDFVREFGPFIASRRDICFKSSEAKLDYSCMSEQ